jgi:hypothetical protein
VNKLRAWAHRLACWLLENEDDRAIALTRVGVALCVIYIGAVGLLDRSTLLYWVDQSSGGIGSARETFWVMKAGGLQPGPVFAVCKAEIVVGVLLLLGIFPRAMSLLGLTTTLSLTRLAPSLASAGDALLACALFLLGMSKHGRSLSLMHLLHAKKWWSGDVISSYGRKLVLYQVVVMYVATGLQKTVSSAWTPWGGGSALHGILQSPQWTRFHDLPLGMLEVFTRVGSVVTWTWEIAFFVVLVRPRWRVCMALVGVGLHFGIFALMEVGVFSFITLALYPALFSGDEWRSGAQLLWQVIRRQVSWRVLLPVLRPWARAVGPHPAAHVAAGGSRSPAENETAALPRPPPL